MIASQLIKQACDNARNKTIWATENYGGKTNGALL